MKKLENLQSVPRQLTELSERLSVMESEVKHLNAVFKDMAESVDFLDNEVANIKTDMKKKADSTEIQTLKDKVSSFELSIGRKFEDLENRSRRNNLIFHGVPEDDGVGPPRNLESLIKDDILRDMMGIDVSSIHIERVHRTPSKKVTPRQTEGSLGKPRPIHVRFLRYTDRENVLRSAPSMLKNKTYRGKTIYISDDVSAEVRKLRKNLRQKLPEIKQQTDVQYAYISWSIPPRIVVVKNDGSRQFLRSSELIVS